MNMPGQSYHYGFSRLLAEKTGREFTNKLAIGTLVIDSLNSAAGSRRASHFCGGAGCVLPRLSELRQGIKIQSFDSRFKESYLVDPMINMRLFEAVNIHLAEDEYKDGIRIHLLADREYDRLVQNTLFDVSNQKNNQIRVRSTGRIIDGQQFRKELYASYPMLDQYILKKAGVTEDEINEVKELLFATLNDDAASFISKYLNFNPDLEWHDTEFFNESVINQLIDQTLETVIKYIKK